MKIALVTIGDDKLWRLGERLHLSSKPSATSFDALVCRRWFFWFKDSGWRFFWTRVVLKDGRVGVLVHLHNPHFNVDPSSTALRISRSHQLPLLLLPTCSFTTSHSHCVISIMDSPMPHLSQRKSLQKMAPSCSHSCQCNSGWLEKAAMLSDCLYNSAECANAPTKVGWTTFSLSKVFL